MVCQKSAPKQTTHLLVEPCVLAGDVGASTKYQIPTHAEVPGVALVKVVSDPFWLDILHDHLVDVVTPCTLCTLFIALDIILSGICSVVHAS